MGSIGRPPAWLLEPAMAVLEDLQGAEPIAGLQIVASTVEGLNGLSLGVLEPSRVSNDLAQLRDDLDPDQPVESSGGNWVPRPLSGPDLMVLVAGILQEGLAETEVAWGQARPPCPYHPHPARTALWNGDAWWVCERVEEPLYRIGRGEVPMAPAPPVSLRPRTGRARKRRRG